MTTKGEKRIVSEEDKKFAKNFNIMDHPDIPTGLPPHLQLQRTRVLCKNDAPIHVSLFTLSFFELGLVSLFNLCVRVPRRRRVSLTRVPITPWEWTTV